MSSDYSTGLVPQNANELPRFIIDELQKLKAGLDILSAGHLDKAHAEPPRPRDGDIRYADGTDWNPGSGAGIYYYNGSAWVFIG
jgi:hypothetical protein